MAWTFAGWIAICFGMSIGFFWGMEYGAKKVVRQWRNFERCVGCDGYECMTECAYPKPPQTSR